MLWAGEDTVWTEDTTLWDRAVFPLDFKGSKRFKSRGGAGGGQPGRGSS